MFLYPKCTRSPEPRFCVENVGGGGTDKRAQVPAGHHNVPATVGGGGLAAGIAVAAMKCILKHFLKVNILILILFLGVFSEKPCPVT